MAGCKSEAFPKSGFMFHPHRIEGYAIVSEDGMLADATGIMPDSLKFGADQAFFESGLDGVDVVVHGRYSHEQQRRSDLRVAPVGRKGIEELLDVIANPSDKRVPAIARAILA